MPIGMLFWVLMILWFLFGLWYNSMGTTFAYGWAGNMLLLFILFGLLGWHDFGPVLQGGR